MGKLQLLLCKADVRGIVLNYCNTKNIILLPFIQFDYKLTVMVSFCHNHRICFQLFAF